MIYIIRDDGYIPFFFTSLSSKQNHWCWHIGGFRFNERLTLSSLASLPDASSEEGQEAGYAQEANADTELLCFQFSSCNSRLGKRRTFVSKKNRI